MASMGGWFRWPLKGNGAPEPAAPPPERERWDVVEIATMCMGTTHSVTFGCRDGVLRSIKTPCGYAAARAMDSLSDNERSCWAMIEPIVLALTDDEIWRLYIAPMAAPDTQPGVQALGGTEGGRRRAGLRAQRRAYANMPSWNRRELTQAALLRLVQHKAGPGTKVTMEEKNGTKVVTIAYTEGDQE
jgi:hypothetical protein